MELDVVEMPGETSYALVDVEGVHLLAGRRDVVQASTTRGTDLNGHPRLDARKDSLERATLAVSHLPQKRRREKPVAKGLDAHAVAVTPAIRVG